MMIGTDEEMCPGETFPLMYCREEKLPHGTRVWTFWCPHCQRDHTHSPEPGHRRAHCGDWRSPFNERGLCPGP